MVSQHVPSRRATLVLTGVVSLITAIAMLTVFGAQASRADGSAPAVSAPKAAGSVPMFTPKAIAFREAMRALWQTHGTYTERAIVDFVGGNPDIEAVIPRLLRNQVDIGNAVKPYYGRAGGHALTELLKAHINDAVAVLKAADAGNAAATRKAEAAFSANGRQIARFLHKANPEHWSLAAMNRMMRIHLNQVVGLAVDQIKGHYGAAIKLYDRYIHHILFGMADMLSQGIIQQFPGRFLR